MANTYQRNKQNFIYRNGYIKEIARKPRMEGIKNEHIKEIMGVKGKPGIIIIERKRLQWCATLKECKRRDYQN
jgi:hypothetical protein